MTQRQRHIVLLGEMGAGKTTVGESLAKVLQVQFQDSDRWLESSLGNTGSNIASSEGVAALHRYELDALDAMLGQASPSVVAAAASVADTPIGRGLLESSTVVWLDALESVLASRRAGPSHRRTQSDSDRERTRSIRHETWGGLADLRVDVSSASPTEVVGQIAAWLGEP